jgi:hypothetical protein
MSRAVSLVALALLGAGLLGCSGGKSTRSYQEPPPPDLQPTAIDYADTDGFDALLESALLNQDPVILIRTGSAKPDWGGRLNAWIAAWNRGGKVEGGPTVRMQAPVALAVDAESIREFRALIDDLMGRVESLARDGAAWWAVERVQRRRVALLRPYNLRFHLGEDGLIQIILFNGRYAEQHPNFVQTIACPDEECCAEWSRGYTCSRCQRARMVSRVHGQDE